MDEAHAPKTSEVSERSRRSPLHARLRAETAALHTCFEQRLDLLGPDLTIERYRLVLGVFHGFHAPLEAELVRRTESVAVPFGLRARAALLTRDLVALGTPPDAIAAYPSCEALPPLSQREQIAGCLYVLEGAALGGQVITRILERRLGLGEDYGAAFFSGEGTGTAARWTTVLAWLDGLASAGASSDAIVDSAAETFRAFSRWAESQGVLR